MFMYRSWFASPYIPERPLHTLLYGDEQLLAFIGAVEPPVLGLSVAGIWKVRMSAGLPGGLGHHE